MNVRAADPAEVDHLARVWFDGWQDAHLQILPAELRRFRTLESFRDRLHAALPQVRVVGPGGAPVGFTIVKDDELYQLYVAAAARGTGVAAALIADAETLIAQSGADTAWLACAISNERAARFYEKHGWRRVGEMISQLDTPEGIFPLKVWRYEKRLSPSSVPEKSPYARVNRCSAVTGPWQTTRLKIGRLAMTVATPTLLGRPLWYELMTTDMKAAEGFYRNVVGWKTAPFEGAGQPYTTFNRSGDAPVGGVMTRPDDVKAPPFWSMYVGVPKIEEAAAKIKRLGGSAHTDVITVADVGRMQLMADPQGALFYIFEPSSNEQHPEAAPEIGEASWHELMTTDWRQAMKFYQDVFGWEPSEAMDMGPMGTYQMFNRPHGMIGGMMNKPPEMANVPPNWQIYFRVADVDAAVERIKANGGQVLNGPMEVPGGDRVLNAMDPQGAAFGLHQKKA